MFKSSSIKQFLRAMHAPLVALALLAFVHQGIVGAQAHAGLVAICLGDGNGVASSPANYGGHEPSEFDGHCLSCIVPVAAKSLFVPVDDIAISEPVFQPSSSRPPTRSTGQTANRYSALGARAPPA